MNRASRIFLKLLLLTVLMIHSSGMFGEGMSVSSPVPTPSTRDFNICTPSFVSLIATGSTGIYRWYTSSEASTLVANPSHVFIAQNKTFYVSALQWIEGKYVESNRVPLNINITGTIAPPIVDTVRVCNATSNDIYVWGARTNEQYKWYADSLGMAAIKISVDENDRSLYAYMDAKTNYYVSIADRSGNCESKRMRIPVIIKSTPSAPTVVSEPVICGNGNARLEVKKEPGYTYLWYPCQGSCSYYSNRSGYGPVYDDNYFDTYLYNYGGISDFTVWVEKISLSSSCAGERIPLTATSYSPQAPVMVHDVYQCRKDIKTVTASVPAGQSEYARINWYADREKTTLLGSGTDFQIPSDLSQKISVYAVVQDLVFNNCESDPIAGEVTIHPKEQPPAPSVAVYQNCGMVNFEIQPQIAGMEYLWYTMDTVNSVHSGAQLVNYHNSEFASEAFYVSAVSADGCVSKKIRTEGHALGIGPAPAAASVERCGYGTSVLKVSGNGKFTQYRWYDQSDNLIIGEYSSEYTTPYLYYTAQYTVAMIGDNGCESEKQKVKVLIKPGVSVSASTQFVCRGESVALYGAGGNFYQWSENGVNISNWSTIYVNPFTTTTYTLTDPTVEGKCQSVSITVVVNKTADCHALALDSAEGKPANNISVAEKAIGKVYPNPFTEGFSVDPSFSGGEYRILDMTGSQLYYFPKGFSGKNINLPLGPGSYILEIILDHHLYREQIIKF